MATTVQTIYGTSAAITLSATGLVSDTNLVAGRAGTVVASTGAADYLISGIVTASSTGVGAKQIEIWAFAQVSTGYFTGLSTGYAGTDANQSPTQKSVMKLLQIIPTTTTTSAVYSWGPFSMAQANGGILPQNWGLFVVHNSCGALNGASGSQIFQYQPITFTSS
jgi:hypothetical protein